MKLQPTYHFLFTEKASLPFIKKCHHIMSFLNIPIALLTHFYDLCFPLILDSSLVTSAPYDFQMDFDVVLKNIRELNILAGEGCSDVSRTKDGARLKVRNFCRTYNKEDNVGLFVD